MYNKNHSHQNKCKMPLTSSPASYPAAIGYHTQSGISAKVIVGIASAHLGLLALLASLELVPLPTPLSALMVHMIAPISPAPTPTVTERRPTPAEPKPVIHPAATPFPRQAALAVAADTAADTAAKTPAAKEAPPASAAPAALPAVTQARFDTDYLLNPAPIYPALSRRLGEEGKVVLRVFVEATGRPNQIELKSGSGSPRLDQAAQDAVWRWKFVAARRGDETLGAWVLVPIVFNLRN